MSQVIIGLDIGHYSIKAIRLRVDHKNFEALGFDEEILDSVTVDPEKSLLAAQAREEDPDGLSEADLQDAIHDAQDEALHTALVELRQRGALAGDLICVAIPPDLVLSSNLRFPFDDDKQLQAVIPAEFEERSPVAVDELILRHHLIGPSRAEEGLNDVMVSGLKESDLEIFLDLWRAGDADPHFVEMGDTAMLRLAPYLLAELREPYAVVDIGHHFTRVICVEPEAERWSMGYVRSFQVGGQDVTRALGELLGCKHAEAEQYKHARGFISVATLAHGIEEVKVSDAIKRACGPLVRELRRTFQAHMDERREPITRVFACGGGSRLRGLLAHLQEEIGVPVEPLPVAGQELAGLALPKPELAAQALSLAMREVSPRGARVDMNFRVGRFEHQGARGWFREKVMGLVVVVALLLCMIGALFGSRYFAVTQQHDASKAALEQATERLFGKQVLVEKKVRDLLGGGQEDNSILPRRNAHEYFFEVYDRVPKGGSVDLAKVDVDLFRQLIKIEAFTDNVAQVDAYTEALEKHPCFEGQIQRGSTNKVGEEFKFDLTIAPECPENRKVDKKKKKK